MNGDLKAAVKDLSTTDIITLADSFYKAADGIDSYGWRNEGAIFNPEDVGERGPRCIYLGLTHAITTNGLSVDTRIRLNRASAEVLEKHFDMTLGEIFDYNDSIQDNATGKKWAIDNLDAIADSLHRIAFARSGEKAMDIDSIEQTDSGNAINVDGRVKRLLKRLHLAR